MMLRAAQKRLFVVSLAIVTLASAASAATFDLIWADRINVTTFPQNVGFSTGANDIALVVNKGVTDMGAAEFFGATFTVTTSNPAVQAYPFILNAASHLMPIHPNEAFGNITGLNGVLTSKILAGETLHNTSPYVVMTLGANYPEGFVGSVVFDFTMTIGGNVAHYSMLATFTAGSNSSDFAITFPSAARVSSTSIPTTVKPTTWGAIKKLYH